MAGTRPGGRPYAGTMAAQHDDDGPVPPPDRTRAVPSFGRAFALYNLGRLLLFAAATVLVYGVLRLNGLPLLLVALIASALLSLVVLRRQREDLGLAIQARAHERVARRERVRARLDEVDGQ